MTDQEFQRRINRDFDNKTLILECILVLIFVSGGLALLTYMAMTRGQEHGSSGAIRDE